MNIRGYRVVGVTAKFNAWLGSLDTGKSESRSASFGAIMAKGIELADQIFVLHYGSKLPSNVLGRSALLSDRLNARGLFRRKHWAARTLR
jgi:hypothetical protein